MVRDGAWVQARSLISGSLYESARPLQTHVTVASV